MELRPAVAIFAVCGLALAGCGDKKGSEATAVGSGVRRMPCERGFIGAAPADWRREATWAGPIGLGGSGRDFDRIRRREGDGLFHTKTPVVVERGQVAELVVPPAEADRIAFEVTYRGGPYRRLIFHPCEDKRSTPWAAGLALRDRRPVRVEARWDGGSALLRVGSRGKASAGLP